jgi:transcriptional regulator with XRE-family HTH domain
MANGMPVFSERIIQLKKEKNLLQKDIAKALGLSLRAYQHYEYCEKEPTLGNIIKICEYFNVSSDWLLGLSDKRDVCKPTSEEAAAIKREAI